MLKKTTVEEIITEIAKGTGKITDNSVCGKCSKCGECCTPFLPVTQEEVNTIQRYVVAKNIKPQRQMLYMENRLTCPYYNGKKCLIYDVRPLICQEFYCYKPPTYETCLKFAKGNYTTVNMWAIAEEIEKKRKEVK